MLEELLERVRMLEARCLGLDYARITEEHYAEKRAEQEAAARQREQAALLGVEQPL